MESLRLYDAAMKIINEFMEVVSIRNGEVWIREEVCLGRPEKPEIRIPINYPSEYLGQALHHIDNLVESISGSLKTAIDAAKEGEAELESLQVSGDSISQLRIRTERLQSLLNALMIERDRLHIAHHPELLFGWHQIFDSTMKSGDAGIRVQALVTYIV